ncbi:MAG: hypothetical protein HOP11_10030 [Saprospiraceae bacterium]|nr:hypothetical protein [Saprospiraceae bacterium]
MKYYVLITGLLTQMFLFGQTWKPQVLNNPGYASFDRFSVPNIDNYWIVSLKCDSSENITYTGAFLNHTIDGGKNWNSYSLPFIQFGYVESIFALDEKTAWIAGNDFNEGPFLYKSINGGKDWEKRECPIQIYANKVHFFDAKNGILIDDNNQDLRITIYITRDGGESWGEGKEAAYGQSDEYLLSNMAISGDSIWMPTNTGRILFSSDRGENWEEIFTVDNIFLWSVERDLQGNLYAPFVMSNPDGSDPKLTLLRSSDNFKTNKVITPNDNNWWILDIEPVPGTNTIIAQFNKGLGNKVTQTRISYDQGDHWIVIDTTTHIGRMYFSDSKNGFTGRWEPVADNSTSLMYYYNGSPLLGIINDTRLNIEWNAYYKAGSELIQISFYNELPGKCLLLINDVQGKLVYTRMISPDERDIILPSDFLMEGIYNIAITNAEGTSARKVEIIR